MLICNRCEKEIKESTKLEVVFYNEEGCSSEDLKDICKDCFEEISKFARNKKKKEKYYRHGPLLA